MPFEYYFFLGTAFILGAVIGSFLNVCIYRIPVGKSIVSPPSACPHCGHQIRWFQNVPILSYLFLMGKCAGCRKGISLRYPLIEGLSGMFFVLVLYAFGLSLATPIYWFFVAGLIVVTFIDLDHQIIPDVISLPGIVIGFLCSFMVPWLGWMDSFFGIVLGGGLLLVIAWGYHLLTGRDGMGGGDIKLLAMIGAFLGWKSIFPIIFLASLVGSLVGVPLMLLRREGSRLALPFGPFLSLAAMFFLLWGDQLIHWYLNLFR